MQLRPRCLAFGDDLAILFDVDQVAVEVAPFTTLDSHQLRWRLLVGQPFADDPGEVSAVQVTVADLDQLAGHELRALVRHWQARAL
ncbi:hypothetical protein D3C81_1898450 [compost metagenome]